MLLDYLDLEKFIEMWLELEVFGSSTSALVTQHLGKISDQLERTAATPLSIFPTVLFAASACSE